jgi:GNAT superfamily N-acetyltransferase
MVAVYAAPMRRDDGVRVRPAAPGDAGELARLRWEHCIELWDRPPEAAPDRGAFEEEFRRFLSRAEPDDAWMIWVAETTQDAPAGRLCGTLSLYVVPMVPTPWRSGRTWGYVTSAQVDPVARGRGVGRMLMRAAEEWARAHGLEQLLLWSAGDSPAFYEALGFRRPPIVMERPLT